MIALLNCRKVPSMKRCCFRPENRLVFCVADGCSCAMAAISITNTCNDQIAFKVRRTRIYLHYCFTFRPVSASGI